MPYSSVRERLTSRWDSHCVLTRCVVACLPQHQSEDPGKRHWCSQVVRWMLPALQCCCWWASLSRTISPYCLWNWGQNNTIFWIDLHLMNFWCTRYHQAPPAAYEVMKVKRLIVWLSPLLANTPILPPKTPASLSRLPINICISGLLPNFTLICCKVNGLLSMDPGFEYRCRKHWSQML